MTPIAILNRAALAAAAVGIAIARHLMSTLRNPADNAGDEDRDFLGADQGGGLIHLGEASK